MNKLRNEIINKIMLYTSHPVTDLFKEAVKTVNEELYEIKHGEYTNESADFCYVDDMSVAEYFFFDRRRMREYKIIFDEWLADREGMEE